MENGSSSKDPVAARKIANQALKGYYLVDGILFFEDSAVPGRCRMVVPTQLRRQVLLENHTQCSVCWTLWTKEVIATSQPAILLAGNEG